VEGKDGGGSEEGCIYVSKYGVLLIQPFEVHALSKIENH
jgi:hypothetical protein